MKHEHYLDDAVARYLAANPDVDLPRDQVVGMVLDIFDHMEAIARERTAVISVDLDKDVLRWMAQQSADREVTINDIMEEALLAAIAAAPVEAQVEASDGDQSEPK